jgi:PAS domain S-box-containing protein
MPTSPRSSDTVVSVSRGAHRGPYRPTEGPYTKASLAEKLSLPLATITTHDLALGTLVASAGTPSVDSEDVALNDEDVSPAISRSLRAERRRNPQHSQSPMTSFTQLPALLVLERMPVPVLAIAHDGGILFTNTAFAEMVGREPDEVLSLQFHHIFHRAPVSDSLLSVVHALANMIVELVHKDGWVVRARMSRSALVRADDQFALATFQDLTTQLWEQER